MPCLVFFLMALALRSYPGAFLFHLISISHFLVPVSSDPVVSASAQDTNAPVKQYSFLKNISCSRNRFYLTFTDTGAAVLSRWLAHSLLRLFKRNPEQAEGSTPSILVLLLGSVHARTGQGGTFLTNILLLSFEWTPFLSSTPRVRSVTCNNDYIASRAMKLRIRVRIEGRVASVTDNRLLQVCFRWVSMLHRGTKLNALFRYTLTWEAARASLSVERYQGWTPQSGSWAVHQRSKQFQCNMY